MTALLTDLLRPVREAAEGKDRPVQKSVRADVERIHDHADRLEVDAAPGHAIFASDIDGLFTVEALAHRVPNISSLGPRPYLRPLRAAPKALRAGVIVADRSQTRVFVGSRDLIDEVTAPLIADIGKSNYGGFAGYEEHGVRGRADEVSNRMWREAGLILLEKHQERPFDFLSIGGHGELVEDIARTLHPYLDRLHRATFHAGPQTVTIPALRQELVAQSEEVRRRNETDLATRVCDTALSDGQAVLGLTAVLAACNAQAVDTLVIAGEFRRAGAMCNNCGFLARTGSVCQVCGSTMFQVDDIVAAAMESTVGAGGRAHQLVVPSPLDTHGIGALTRFALSP
jgi:peptide chain release factor subunit 1